jgi:hypothetical protein
MLPERFPFGSLFFLIKKFSNKLYYNLEGVNISPSTKQDSILNNTGHYA